jgi:hypothetical protein
MVVHADNLSTQEAEAGGLKVQGQPRLPSKFKDGLISKKIRSFSFSL